MSLNFNFNKFKCGEKKVDFVFEDVIQGYRSDFIEKNILKFFDNCFLSYISNRKQRDLILINYFYQLMFDETKINKNVINDKKLSKLFSVKNGRFLIDEEVSEIFNMKEIVKELEHDMLLLKTMDMFFNDNIKIKIKKVINLNDDSAIERLTSSKELKEKILNKFERVKNYEELDINTNFYHSLKQMLENKELFKK